MSVLEKGEGDTAMDCIIPYQRKAVCVDFKPEDTKFSFEQEVESTKKTTRTDAAGQVTVTEETSIEMKTKKVTLKTYGQSDKEDCEHFFEALERLKRELRPQWETASEAKDRDAAVLFDAIDQMLIGTANSEWHDVLATSSDRDWEAFKTLVAKFITTKVLPEDAYNRQIIYMQERRKPYKLSVRAWWLRMQTMDRYLPYFIPDKETLKRLRPKADFSKWWVEGSLSEEDKKRIILTKVPREWQDELKRVDVGHNLRNTHSIEELVDYFTSVEQLELHKRQPARRTAASVPGVGPRAGPPPHGRAADPFPDHWRERSQPVPIQVVPADQVSAGAAPRALFLDTQVDATSPYVQEPSTYRVRVYYREPPRRATLSEPQADGATIQQRGDDQSTTEMVEGQRYTVIERRYLVVPQRSGPITMAVNPRLEALVPDSRPGARRSPFADLDEMLGGRVFQGMPGLPGLPDLGAGRRVVERGTGSHAGGPPPARRHRDTLAAGPVDPAHRSMEPEPAPPAGGGARHPHNHHHCPGGYRRPAPDPRRRFAGRGQGLPGAPQRGGPGRGRPPRRAQDPQDGPGADPFRSPDPSRDPSALVG